MIYELNITLENVEPIVYRQIWIESEASFSDLHKVIQLSFDWWDYHQHYFVWKNSDEKQLILLPNHLYEMDHFVSNSWQKEHEEKVKLRDLLTDEGDEIRYTYDFGNNWVHKVVLQRKLSKIKAKQYPCCIDARNYSPPEESKLEILRGQREIETANISSLKKKINYLLETYGSKTICDEQKHNWKRFYDVSNTYYTNEAWKRMRDDQIFAFYIEEFDEYLFCSVLGSNNEIYGFTAYQGFHGFVSLYASLMRNISIDTIMQYQTSVLLQFDTYDEHSKKSFPFHELMPEAMKEQSVWPYMTSYQAGFYPWKINENELKLMTIALEETISLLNDDNSFETIPSFKNDQIIFYTTIKSSVEKRVQKYVTIDEIFRKINPVKNAISEIEMKKVSKLSKELNITVEFAMRYINIPIQRLKGNRPFFPVTSVMAEHQEGKVLYHNIFDDPLHYENVQRELLEMIYKLGGIPEKILVDEFIYFYLKPVINELNLPVEIVNELPCVDEVVGNISQILAAK